MTMKNNIHDYRIDTDKFFGIYRGVVEDRFDPELLGRCKVRVLGVHDELIEKDHVNGIPTDELPWAEPCYGLSEGMISGNGNWVVPLQGSYVFVFFENGNWMQPRFFLTAPGMPELKPDKRKGFNDPAEEWPNEEWLNESDVHRLAKVYKVDDTSLETQKRPGLDLGVAIAIGGTWDEVGPMYQAQYPYNQVNYSHGGVYTEMDATPGAERYHIYHPSNSYIEINVEGNTTFKSTGSRWDMVMVNKMEHTAVSHHRNVGNERSSYVGSSEFEQVGVNHNKEIGVMCRESIGVNRWHDVLLADMLNVTILKSNSVGILDYRYNSLFEGEFTGMYKVTWHEMFNDSYTGLIDREIIGLEKIKWIMDSETIQVDRERHSWVSEYDLFESDGTIHLKTNVSIILEAPEIEFRAESFRDLAAETQIAGELTWNDVAIGCAAWAVDAGTAQTAAPAGSGPGPQIAAVAAVAPEEVPIPVSPLLPPRPIAPPPSPPILPPGPPAIPEYEYEEVEPEEDTCDGSGG